MSPSVNASDFVSQSYDYVIVGGGTAGLVVAARLSEDPNVTVGVIEAGEYVSDMDQINIPGLAGSALMHERIDWRFSTVPQKGAKNRVIAQPRGKVLGGSSALNLLITGRASRQEYDALEGLGNPGWNWSEFLKYFRKSETLTYPSSEVLEKYRLQLDTQFHGSDGPIQNSYPRYLPELRDNFTDTLDALGIHNNPEPAGGSSIGSTFTTITVHPEDVTRSYSTTAYYEPNAQRKNLILLTGAHATKVILEGVSESIFATGVEFLYGRNAYIVKAEREVILSAGSFQTPQLLELSGIGKREILAKYNIPTVIDLPDHTFVTSVFETRPECNTTDFVNIPVEREKEINIYKTHKQGVFSSVQSGSYSFVPLRTFAPPNDLRRFEEMIAQDRIYLTSPSLTKQFGLLKTWLDDPAHAQVELVYRPQMRPGAGSAEPGKKYQTIMTCSMNTFSRGSVHIQSSDPLVPPAIDPAYFTHPIDMQIMVSAVKFARKIAGTQPFASTIVGPVEPGPDVQSDEQFADYCRDKMSPVFHPVGSASMLPRSDGGVVSPSLLVYGTKNLRVVDASVIPMELACHIQSTVYAIAEKAADIIKSSLSVQYTN